MNIELTHERLLHLLHYDPVTGLFTWMNPQSKKMRRGEPAGGVMADGYLRIKIDGVGYRAHRLAIFYMTGTMPAEEIDHKNRKRLDNKWGNLREASHQENQCNRSLTRANTSGVVGVSWDKRRKKWAAQIKIVGRGKLLGRYDTLEEAVEVRRRAEIEHFGDFAPRHWMGEEVSQ